MSCVCKRQRLYILVIHSKNLNKYDIKSLNNLIILSIYKEEVDNLDIKYIVNNFIKNGDVKLRNVPRWSMCKPQKHYVILIICKLGGCSLIVNYLVLRT